MQFGTATPTQTNPFSGNKHQITATSKNPFSEKYNADHADSERLKESYKTEDRIITNPFSSDKNGPNRAKRAQVSNACNNCRKKKAGCDKARPCKRCITGGEEASCCDTPRKKRSTGPRSSQNDEVYTADSPSSGSSSSGNNSSAPDSTGISSHPRPSTPPSPSFTTDSPRMVLPPPPRSPFSTPSLPSLVMPPPPSPLQIHNPVPPPLITPREVEAAPLKNMGTNEVRSSVNGLYKDKEKITRLLIYLTDKYGERELLAAVADCNSSVGSEGVEMVLIKDYTKAIFKKASSTGDWNAAVANIVTLIDDGIQLLNAKHLRSAMLFFTGFLEGLFKYDPWMSCFAQGHRHTADVPYLVDTFCAKILEFENVFNEYEWEILRARLEPFSVKMDKAEHFRKIIPETNHFGQNPMTPAQMDPIFARKLSQLRLPSIQSSMFDGERMEDGHTHTFNQERENTNS